jgi:hypothetical protein
MANRINTPRRLMTRASKGHLTKHALAGVLTTASRHQFLEACERIERQYTVECAAANSPCLDSGCSVDGEICLAPLLRAGNDYQRACGTEWAKLFAVPENRVAGWEMDVAGWNV